MKKNKSGFKNLMKKMCIVSMCAMMGIMSACGTKTDNNTAGTSAETNSETSLQEENTESYVAKDMKIAAMKGPTGIGLVKLIKDSKDGKTANNYEFTLTAAADEFTASLIKGDIHAAALPANAAATLYNKSQGKIQVIGINTLGVLYIVENSTQINSVADLKGKTIYLTGKGTTPEYTLRYLLNSAGINPDTDVTLEFKSEATEIAAIMASGQENVVAMLPQPFVTTAMMNNDKVRIALDVTKEWEKLAGSDSTVVTGVVVVNTEYYKNNKAAVDKFMEEYAASVDYVVKNVDDAATLVEEAGIIKAAVAKKAIPYCNITLIQGSEMKTKLSKYLQVLCDENPAAVGGKMPAEDFYIQ